MPRVVPFEENSERYERWFTRHKTTYQSEVQALATLLKSPGFSLEIGVGTGRVAAPLGVRIGIDPSLKMLRYAREREIEVVCGVGEALPFREGIFDNVLIVTTICFVDDARTVLTETRRVLKPNGAVVIGFIDRTSSLGQNYQANKRRSVFYKDANFFSANEVDYLLSDTGFSKRTWVQTLCNPLSDTTEVEPARPGYGDGAFVVVRAERR